MYAKKIPVNVIGNIATDSQLGSDRISDHNRRSDPVIIIYKRKTLENVYVAALKLLIYNLHQALLPLLINLHHVHVYYVHDCVVNIAQHGPFRATQLWNELVEVLRQEISVKRRRIGRHQGQEQSFSGTDAVDIVLKFLRERRDQFTTSHDSSRRDKAVKVLSFIVFFL